MRELPADRAGVTERAASPGEDEDLDNCDLASERLEAAKRDPRSRVGGSRPGHLGCVRLAGHLRQGLLQASPASDHPGVVLLCRPVQVEPAAHDVPDHVLEKALGPALHTDPAEVPVVSPASASDPVAAR